MTPEGWRSLCLSDILREAVRNGYSPVCPAESTGKWILSLGAVTHEGFDSRALKPAPLDDPRVDTATLQEGDIVVSRSNTRERVGLAGLYEGIPSPCSYPDLLMRLRLTAKAAPEFVIFCLLSQEGRKYFQQSARGTSGSMLKIDRGILEAFPLLLPPLGEQRKIAAILSSVDDAIEATQAVLDQLQVVKKAMMAELLTRGLPGRHTRFKMTEIGEIPEEWEVVRLSSVGHLQTGLAKGKAVASGVDLPYLRVANVQDGRVDLGEVKTITVEEKSIDRYRLRPGDVLFTEGGDADKLGRGCVWRGQIDPCLHQNHVFAVRPQTQRLLPEFLSYWAASPRGKSYFLDCAKQTTNLASINSTQLKALPVPLPRLPEQSAIVEALGSVEGRLRAEDAVVHGMRAAKSALMSVLLTGEVRVKPDEGAPA